MATKPSTAFMDKLLAPLPDGVEPVDAAAYLKQLCCDAKTTWQRQMALTRRAEHLRHSHDQVCSEEATLPYFEACDKQMMVLASSRAALRWKEGTRKFGGGREHWEVAIERDKAWLAKLDAAGVRI